MGMGQFMALLVWGAVGALDPWLGVWAGFAVSVCAVLCRTSALPHPSGFLTGEHRGYW